MLRVDFTKQGFVAFVSFDRHNALVIGTDGYTIGSLAIHPSGKSVWTPFPGTEAKGRKGQFRPTDPPPHVVKTLEAAYIENHPGEIEPRSSGIVPLSHTLDDHLEEFSPKTGDLI